MQYSPSAVPMQHSPSAEPKQHSPSAEAAGPSPVLSKIRTSEHSEELEWQQAELSQNPMFSNENLKFVMFFIFLAWNV